MRRVASLTFDFEECDLPRESGIDFSLDEGMAVSAEGANVVLDVLERRGVKATFFCTLNFADRAPEIMRRIIAGGHEVAAHGVDHFRRSPDDPWACKEGIERLYPGTKVTGYRQPRMFAVDCAALKAHGFAYDASLNPAFVPGRYMHLSTPRTRFVEDGLVRIPASVTPHVRFPLFWLSLHVLPLWLYLSLVRRTLRHDGFFTTYFHPWEFSATLAEKAQALKVPMLVRRNLGKAMSSRLDSLVASLSADGAEFLPLSLA